MIGSKLGPYEVIEEIGKGGMASVYRAFHPNMHRYVAVKIIRQSIIEAPGALERFQREARLIARLEHPHLLPVYDFDGAHIPPYIVMRYLEGGTLKEVMSRRPLPFQEVAYLIRQIASALDYAHRQGIVHRDIKPSNIMIDREGNAFVTDFGIARIAGRGEATNVLTQTGSAVGTPDYMSPEQGHGKNTIDARADIYSLGVLLFELASGQLPFRGETPLATILKHVQDPVPSAVALNPSLPDELDEVLSKAMSKEPEDRFQSVNEFSNGVVNALKGQVAHTPVSLRAAAQETIAAKDEKDAEVQARTAHLETAPATTVAPPDTDSQGTPLKQNKLVTVLFADASDLSDILYEVIGESERVERQMQSLWTKLSKLTRQLGGKEECHGDTLTALWGSESTLEDDPERAVHAALKMLDEVRSFAGEYLEEDEELPVRIGVNTGQVLLTPDEKKGEFQASGVTLNVANRLAQASDGSVLITHDTFRHVRGVFTIEEDTPIKIRGRSERVPIYQVTGVKPRAFRLDTRVLEGVETRMVGRQAEFNLLKELTYTVKEEGETQVVTIVGPAGIGKSRLLFEWLNWEELLPDDMWGFQVRATRDKMHIPYALIRDLFTFRFGIQDNDPLKSVRKKFESGVARFMGPGHDDKAHLIGQLTGFDFSDSPHVAGVLSDPKQLHDHALRSIGEFFRALARDEDNSASITIEDMHWADDRSLDVINHLVEGNQDLYLLVIGLTRPELYERRPQWNAGLECHTRIDLRALSKRESRLLVKEVLQRVEEVPKTLSNLIVERSEGNPFYIEELIKMLLEDRVIVKENPGTPEESWYVELERLAGVRVPPTLRGLIQTRIDSLFPAERSLLQRASVIGRTFWDSAVKALESVDGISADTQGSLQTLTERELVFAREESAFSGSVEYIFGNNLLRDVLYQSILQSQRRGYHARVASWLIESGGDRAGELTALIAQHYELADDTFLATEYLDRAGQQALQVGAYQDAIAFFERGVSLAKGEATEETNLWLARLQLRLGLAYEDLGQRAQAVKHLEDGLEKARELGDKPSILETLNVLGQVTGKWGRFSEAEAYLNEALTLAEELDDRRGMAQALLWIGAHTGVQGQHQKGREYLERSVPLAQETGDRTLAARALNALGENFRLSGENDEAELWYQKALEIYRELGNQFGVGLANCNLGHIALAQDDTETAKKRYLPALRTIMSIGAVPVGLEIIAGLADLEARDGEPEKAVELLGLSVSHELTDEDTRIFAEPILKRLQKELPLDRYEAAFAKSHNRKLEDVVKALLEVGS